MPGGGDRRAGRGSGRVSAYKLFEEARSGSPVNGAIHATATPQGTAGCVGDRVDVLAGDVPVTSSSRRPFTICTRSATAPASYLRANAARIIARIVGRWPYSRTPAS